MTWDDDPDFEDHDVLAAPSYSGGDQVASRADEDPTDPLAFVPEDEAGATDVDADDDAWGPEQGFPDPTGSVRVWGDSDGTLQKVRISLNWKQRLGGRPMGEAVSIAFMFMNNYLHIYETPGLPEVGDLGPELTSEQRAKARARIAAIDGELEALDPQKFPGVIEHWEPAVGSDFQDGVRVELDSTGRPAVARFDRKWLDTANSRELSLGIMSSYRKARAAYRPPVYELDRRGELLAERRRLSASLALRPAPGAPEVGPVTESFMKLARDAQARRAPRRVAPSSTDTGADDWRTQ